MYLCLLLPAIAAVEENIQLRFQMRTCSGRYKDSVSVELTQKLLAYPDKTAQGLAVGLCSLVPNYYWDPATQKCRYSKRTPEFF